MKLQEQIKDKLDNRVIVGRDRKKYAIQVIVNGNFSVVVIDIEDKSRYGIFPVIRDLGTQLFEAEVVEFMSVSGNGLYKKVLRMISEAVPDGTSYRSSMVNSEDQWRVLEYVNKNKVSLDVRSALEKTCLGHVLLASQFNNVQLFYEGSNGTEEGINALLSFSKDRKNGIFTSSHGTDIYLIGTK